VLPSRFRKQLTPAAQNHIQIFRPDRVKAIILKIQIDDLPPIHSLNHKFLNGIKEQKGLSGTPDTRQTDYLAGTCGQSQLSGLADRQDSFNKLANNIF
jgi:hypothetical protein